MKKANVFLTVVLAAVILFSCGCTELETRSGQHPQTLNKVITKKVDIEYFLYLPKDYGKSDKEWPLMMFLHGAGERGDDINRVKSHGPARLASEGKGFEFIIISPQCPRKDWWSNKTDTLITLLDHIIDNYKVDKSRVYLTGLSMGGYGTWKLAGNNPGRFAAIAPICGGGDRVIGKYRLKKMPIWVFHGAKDNVVPLEESEKMVKALKDGGNEQVKFTVYPEAGHDSWTETYNNPELYEWFLEHRIE